MAEINILPPHLADLIAAGEVVERPASVIKELCENAFDAGAKNISIEFKGGGLTYIRVTDDGCGMLPEDAGVCFLRHATSKLINERSLEAIGTMGFRGEALAAISAVSRTELITRRRGEQEGVRVMLKAGEILEMTPCGCPEGTTVIIRDLFYNTPARLKFMKSDRAEGAACASLALRCALGMPEVSVRLIKDGKEEFFSPGDGRKASAVYSLLGRETAGELLECASSDGAISVSGFVAMPKFGHGNRSKQFFFCNKRNIRSALLQTAVEQAYKNTLLTGRYPACVIYLSISPGSVDVNVHPTKLEVKFREERRVFDMIYNAALSALNAIGKPAETSHPLTTKDALFQTCETTKSSPDEEFLKNPYEPTRCSDGSSAANSAIGEESALADRGTVLLRSPGSMGGSYGNKLCDSQTPYNLFSEKDGSRKSHPTDEEPRQPISRAFDLVDNENVIKETLPGEDSKSALSEAVPDFRLVGEAMKTYIIVEKGDEIIFIDKHAAHERMVFDRLKRQGLEIMSQTLLLPVPLKLSGGEMELLEQNSAILSRLGFEIEPYGEESMILRAVPADIDAGDAGAMVEEICEKLRCGAISETEYIDEILHTVACKAAIKSGFNTTNEELLHIAEKVVSGEIRYCPHGRPVSTALTKTQLDKEFSRIV